MDEGMSSFAGLGEAAIIDCETTGLDPATDRAVTVAAIRADFSQLDQGTTLTTDSLVVEVSPGIPIPQAAGAVHGLRDADVAAWPPFADEVPALGALTGMRGVERCSSRAVAGRGVSLPQEAGQAAQSGYAARTMGSGSA